MPVSLVATRFESAPQPSPGLENNVSNSTFRAAMRHLPSGVSVITTGRGEERTGFTATSTSSRSVEPPTMLVTVNRASSSYPTLARSRIFGVNILGADCEELAARFSGTSGARGVERYETFRWFVADSGVWLLSDALAAFDCEVEDIIERHTHAIVIGRVKSLSVSEAPGALVYWRGAFDRMGWSAEEAANAVGLVRTRST